MFENKDTIKILSIDGGGMRGIIPALILTEIEKKKQKKIYELFDFFAGTSTGGIISLLLNKPNPCTAQDIIGFYNNEGVNTIFKKNLLTGLKFFMAGKKYDKKGIESVLSEKFESYCLKDSLKPVLIPSYETQTRDAVFFNSYEEMYADICLKEVARATSSAPTYFEPFHLQGTGTMIDGGIAANNPAMCAYVEAIKLMKRENIDWSKKKIIMVSLGTGTQTTSIKYDEIKKWNLIDWIKGPLISSFFDGSNDTVQHQMKVLLPEDCYYRFQLELPNEKGSDDLDNTDTQFLSELSELTMQYIQKDSIHQSPVGWRYKLDKLLQIL